MIAMMLPQGAFEAGLVPAFLQLCLHHHSPWLLPATHYDLDNSCQQAARMRALAHWLLSNPFCTSFETFSSIAKALIFAQ
jgi:hypothetical protein